jgi:nicotinate-nucleotide--dimethylbenzimidazole phosphoribosyltransferase
MSRGTTTDGAPDPGLDAVTIPSPIEAEAALAAAVARIGPLDESAMAIAAAGLDGLTKPPGSLGRLEGIVVDLAGITGRAAPSVDRRTIVVAAADHGVARQGVSAYPAAVTTQMVANFLGGGAAIDVLAAGLRARLVVLDVGVAGPAPTTEPVSGVSYLGRRVRAGTDDLSVGPAMSRDEAQQAIGIGLAVAEALAADGVELLGVGEMGIGNTTAASAIVAAMTGGAPGSVTGRGTGLDDAGRARKIATIERALARNATRPDDPVGVLAAVGGLEIAALCGLILGAAAAAIPVVLDGFITGAAALLASTLAPDLPPRLFAGHRSVEPGHAVVLARLWRDPLLDLDLRLGEGTGAALAMGIITAAVRLRDGMATFEGAAVSGPA